MIRAFHSHFSLSNEIITSTHDYHIDFIDVVMWFCMCWIDFFSLPLFRGVSLLFVYKSTLVQVFLLCTTSSMRSQRVMNIILSSEIHSIVREKEIK